MIFKMRDIKLFYKLNKDWRPESIKVKRAGGQTNRNWIVQHKNKKFFVRFPWERTDIVDREVEAKNILALTKCKKLVGVVPKFFTYVYQKKNILETKDVKKFNFPDGTMIIEYIEGKDIDGKYLANPKIQIALLKALHSFHSSGVKFANVYDVFKDELVKYRKEANKYPINKLIKKERIKKIEKIEKEIQKKLPFGGKISTHNDLIFENLRLAKDGKVRLLDFEYSGFNIREGLHYDLGIILGGNLFQKNSIKLETFKKILKKAKKIYKRKIDDYKIYCGALTNVLVMFWWGLVKYFSSNNREEKKYFKKYVLDRARGIEFLYEIINKNKEG